jgi:ankyrin repeat protein
MTNLIEDTNNLFDSMQAMLGRGGNAIEKQGAAAEVFRLIEVVPIEATNCTGETVLVKAAEGGDEGLVRHLLKMGANIEGANEKKKGFLTPLMAASEYGHVEVMKILIDAGAKIHASSDKGNALYYAVKSASVEAVRLLLINGLTTFSDDALESPIHMAAGWPSQATLLIPLLQEHGADISAVDSDGLTALHCVASAWDSFFLLTGTTVSLAAILDHGAAIDQLSRDGQSALHYAVTNLNGENVQNVLFLLGRGANAALADSAGLTALHKAARRRDPQLEIITGLLAHGAPVDAVDGQGRTPLHYIVSREKGGYPADVGVPAARLLLQAGADANATDANGDAPLHLWARRCPHATCTFAELLIDHGAVAAARNNAGQRPSDVIPWVICWNNSFRTFLLAAEEAQRNNHRYKRPRPEDLQPPVVAAAGAEASEQGEEEDESEDDSEDEDEDEDD